MTAVHTNPSAHCSDNRLSHPTKKAPPFPQPAAQSVRAEGVLPRAWNSEPMAPIQGLRARLQAKKGASAEVVPKPG